MGLTHCREQSLAKTCPMAWVLQRAQTLVNVHQGQQDFSRT